MLGVVLGVIIIIILFAH